jgi:hypothetical protein
MAVLWLRRLVAGLSRRRLGFDPESVHVGFVVDNGTETGFSSSTSVFPGVPLYGKTKKTNHLLITGLHNKPQGCGASVASAAGPFIKRTKILYDRGNMVKKTIFEVCKVEL